MMDAYFAREVDRAQALHHRLAPVFKALFSAPSPTPVKYALSRMGFDCESVRLPLVALSSEQKTVVDQAMDALRASV
jgi:4-hydroxy-tetrahydrodipicolinate synthase